MVGTKQMFVNYFFKCHQCYSWTLVEFSLLERLSALPSHLSKQSFNICLVQVADKGP